MSRRLGKRCRLLLWLPLALELSETRGVSLDAQSRPLLDSAIVRMIFESESASATAIKLGVAVLVEDTARALLLDLRRDCGLWRFPGSRVETGQSLAEHAICESREETGLEVCFTGLPRVYSEPANGVVRYPDNSDLRLVVDIVLTAGRVAGGLACSPESFRVKFFPKDCLVAPQTTASLARQAICDYLDRANGTIR